MVNLKIDGSELSVPAGTTIMEAARSAGIDIPSLCYHNGSRPSAHATCALSGSRGGRSGDFLQHPGRGGVRSHHRIGALHEQRVVNLKKILQHHALDCPICDKAGECDLQNIVYRFGITDVPFEPRKQKRDDSYATSLIRYWPERCIMCRRCVTACQKIKGIGAIDILGENEEARLVP